MPGVSLSLAQAHARVGPSAIAGLVAASGRGAAVASFGRLLAARVRKAAPAPGCRCCPLRDAVGKLWLHLKLLNSCLSPHSKNMADLNLATMDRRATTQDISWFLDHERNQQLDLDPSYQRRSVWSPREQRFFLDTIFRGYPSPAIFLHKRVDPDSGKQVYEVVDGKQRLETIIRFVNNKIAIEKTFGDARLDGKKWRQIEDPALKSRFWDYVIPVEFIRLVEGTVVNEVFDRLNRNSRKLERQELRHARYDGWLVTFAENEANDKFWKDFGVVTTSKVKRMKDVQFISELIMVALYGRVQGFDQDAIDSAYAEYDVPQDTDADFQEETVQSKVREVKEYIQAMKVAVPGIIEHLRTSTNFYSLWSVLVLLSNERPDPKRAAEAYSEFLNIVAAIRERRGAGTPDTDLVERNGAAAVYLENATGASTEPAQREKRHEILLALFAEVG